MKIWTIRHPPTHAPGLCVGQRDVPLTMSISQAAQKVIQNAPFTPDHIWSSDLPRCADLALYLAQYWHIPHTFDPRLREISMGIWEGQSYDALQGDPKWEEWCQNWQTSCPPQGESLKDLEMRIQEWRIPDQFSSKSILVSHAGVVRTLYHLSGVSWVEAMQTPVHHLQWTPIDL